MLKELIIHAAAGTNSGDDQSMILLKEKDGERILPLLTSSQIASVIIMRAHVSSLMTLPLPVSTADIGVILMKKFGIRLTRVELTHLKDGVFFCRVVGERDGDVQTVELCQAPDGLLMAVVAKCPIMIEEDLLQAQYMHPTGENSFALNINTLSRKMLEDALQYAVESENYETASRLRDELAKRSSQNETHQE